MGVDITHIIKHDFRHVEDSSLSLEFAKQTIDRLKKELHLTETYEGFYLYQELNDDGISETIFELPIYNVEFTLHNGFWQIESYYHYCQIVMHFGEYFWLRRMTYDIAKALGQNEAWYAEEFYTWNGGVCEHPESTFEQWYDSAVTDYGASIPEFDQPSIIKQGDVHIPDYEPIYHDTFRECNETYNAIQTKLHDYKLLGIARIGNHFLRCENNGQLFLIDERTLRPIFDEPIENMQQNLNGAEFTIIKNGMSALFDGDGKQLTDYVKGTFQWKWDNSQFDIDRKIIYNEEANIEIKIDV